MNNYNYNLASLLTNATTAAQSPAKTLGNTADTATSGTESFANLLQDAINGTVSSDAEHKLQTDALLVGEDSDLHTIAIASQKAELMLSLTVQVRNKMVEAYQEVARMQI